MIRGSAYTQAMAAAAAARPRLLLVDDNDAFREVLVAWLETRYDVVPARSPEVALAEAHRNPPDIVVLDIMMPVFTGIDVYRQLASDARLSAVPVVFLTAHHQALAGQDEELLSRCRVVLKPFRFQELDEQLELALAPRDTPAVD